MLCFGTIGEFALTQITRSGSSWGDENEQSETWTERSEQSETWTERSEQSETWTVV